MKTIKPIYTLNDNVWLYFDLDTGECLVDLKSPGLPTGITPDGRRLDSSIPLGSEATIDPEKDIKRYPKVYRVSLMMNEAWAACLHAGVDPRELHNQLMKIKEYQDMVPPLDCMHELPPTVPLPNRGARQDVEMWDDMPAPPTGHPVRFDKRTGSGDDWTK